MSFLLALGAASIAASAEAPLERISEARALSRQAAQKALPVRVRGVITLIDRFGELPEWLVLDDGSEGIWVQISTARQSTIWRGDDAMLKQLDPGDLLELEGVSHPGGYAPIIVPARITKVGTGALPEPRSVPLESLLSGKEDCQMVEVEGVVQGGKLAVPGNTRPTLAVHAFGQTFQVIAERWENVEPERLIDAVVKVRGVFSPISNFRAEMVALRIRIMGPQGVEILRPPPRDPFSSPKVGLDRLQPFSPAGNSPHRRVTQGVVTFCSPGEFFFVQEGPVAVRVEAPGITVSVGERVEIAGFVDMSRLVASLTGAIVRSLGPAPVPEATPTSTAQLMRPQKVIQWERVVETDYDGRLVRLTGRLRRVEEGDNPGSLQVQIESGGINVTGHFVGLGQADLAAVQRWTEGSILELTGVSEIAFINTSIPEMPRVNGFRLWLRTPQDLRLIAAPSWWTPDRLRFALLLTLILALLMVGWSLALRYLLKRRTNRLHDVLSHHRNTELEFQSAQQERRRLAADLHDGLQQMLAGVSYRLEAAIGQWDHDHEEARTQLDATRRALNATKTGLQECLWGLHQIEEGPADFPALLRHAVESSAHWPRKAVSLEVQGEPFPLSRDVMGSLLLLVQEAIGNAIRHGQAEQVVIRLQFEGQRLAIDVEDNGTGFDPGTAPGTRDGHFGLDGMRQRMIWLGGTFELHGRPGSGARIRISLPREKACTTHSPAPTGSSPK